MVESKYTYMICPSVRSVLLEMMIVMTLFFSFITYIVYLSSYNSGYKPNFIMFYNYLFDDTTSTKNFRTYVENITKDELAYQKQETFRNQNDDVINNFSKMLSKILFQFKKFVMSSFFVRGNVISVSQTI